MKYLLYLIFSSMESFSIVMLGLMLFRYRLNPKNIIRAMFVGIILSIVSLTLDVLGLKTISPLIQLIAMIFLVMIYFNSRILRATLLSFIAYILFAVVQTLFIIILKFYNLVSLDDLVPYTAKGYSIQFFSFLFLVLIASYIRKNRSGFSFDPEESLREKKSKYSNKLFMLLIGSALMLLSGFYYEYHQSNYFLLFEIFFVLVSLVSIILLYITLKRDEDES